MVNIGIIEDDTKDASNLYDMLMRYQKSIMIKFNIDTYTDAMEFFNTNEKKYDIMFLDICLPTITGMEVAEHIRQVDEDMILIFTTTIVDYALKGYEVNAFDYLVKPIGESRLGLTMAKVIQRIEKKKKLVLNVKTAGGYTCMEIHEIRYVEVKDHLLYYYLKDKVVTTWKSLKNAEKELPTDMFVRCNKHIIINLSYIRSLEENSIYLKTGEEFICTGRRKQVMSALNNYINN